jgi:hypothetical protein
MPKQTAVLVTTIHRGVFFGYASKIGGKIIKLSNARNCLYWSSDVKGFLGLAVTGPSKSCKVGPKVPSLILTDVTSISEVTPQAVIAWENSPWSM